MILFLILLSRFQWFSLRRLFPLLLSAAGQGLTRIALVYATLPFGAFLTVTSLGSLVP